MASIKGTFEISIYDKVTMNIEVSEFYGRTTKDAIMKVGAVLEGVRAGTEKKASKK